MTREVSVGREGARGRRPINERERMSSRDQDRRLETGGVQKRGFTCKLLLTGKISGSWARCRECLVLARLVDLKKVYRGAEEPFELRVSRR